MCVVFRYSPVFLPAVDSPNEITVAAVVDVKLDGVLDANHLPPLGAEPPSLSSAVTGLLTVSRSGIEDLEEWPLSKNAANVCSVLGSIKPGIPNG